MRESLVKIFEYLLFFAVSKKKRKLVLLLDKTGYVSQETRPKFIAIDSQNIYFHVHLHVVLYLSGAFF